jgi:circadian clock protein KaiC
VTEKTLSDSEAERRLLTGVEGLDAILGGGFPANHLYLLDGEPGTGKTTFALQFLLEGATRGERCLYVTLSESRAELQGVAASHGWSLTGIDVYELTAAAAIADDYTLFHPAEVELQETVRAVLAAVEEHAPVRVVFDSLSEMRLLARDPLRFRRQILALKQFFAGRECTVLLLDDRSSPDSDMQLHSLAHGVLALEHLAMEYGAERRRLQVTKLRGSHFRGGFHDFRIKTGGIAVFPRISTAGVAPACENGELASGDAGLDELTGGGLTRGTSTLITGAAGTGKSTLTAQYVAAAVARGERAVMYMFDERVSTFSLRCTGVGIDLEAALADGRLSVVQIDPTEMSPGEFAHCIVRAVEENNVNLVVIDSINGYMNAMPAERLLLIQLHELLSYLATHSVSSLLTLVQRGIFGSPVDDAAEVSYLADTVLLLRYFEFHGNVRQAMSVVKKRSGTHERTIREFRMDAGGIKVGAPLTDFQGVLTGVPNYIGSKDPLLAPPPLDS